MRCRHLAGIGWVPPGWAGVGRSKADLLLGSDCGQRKGRREGGRERERLSYSEATIRFLIYMDGRSHFLGDPVTGYGASKVIHVLTCRKG